MGRSTVWTLADIARESGLSVRAVESRMRRLGIRPRYRLPGRAGPNAWAAARVREAWTKRGWRELDTPP